MLRDGPRAVARPAARRLRLRAVRPGRDRPPGGAAAGRARGADRGRPRARPPRARSSASSRRSSPSTRCASACAGSSCSRCTACDRQAEALEAYRHGRHLLVEELGHRAERLAARSCTSRSSPRTRRSAAPAGPRRPPRARGLPAAVARRPRALVLAGVALLAAALSVAAVAGAARRPGPPRPAVPLDLQRARRRRPASGAVDAAVALPAVGRRGGDRRPRVGRRRRLAHRVGDRRPHPPRSCAPCRPGCSRATSRPAPARSGWSTARAGAWRASSRATAGCCDTVRFTPVGRGAGRPLRLRPDVDRRRRGRRVGHRRRPPAAAHRRGRRGRPRRSPSGARSSGVATGAGGVWAISGETAEVLRIDPRDPRGDHAAAARRRRRTLESAYPRAVAAGGGYVWVLSGNTGAVTKIDPRTRGVVGTIKIGVEHVPAQLAADARRRVGRERGRDAGARRRRHRRGRASTRSAARCATSRSARAPSGRATGSATAAGRRSDRPLGCLLGLLAAARRRLRCGDDGEQPNAAVSAARAARRSRRARACTTGDAGRPDVLIASDLPLQGTYANDGLQGTRAVRLVMEERTIRAGPHRVGYVSCDGVDAARRHLAGEVPAQRPGLRRRRATWSASSVRSSPSCAIHMMPVLNRAGLAEVGPSNTYVGLTRAGPGIPDDQPERFQPTGRRNFVRLAAPDDLQGRAHVEASPRERGERSAYVLHDGVDAYGLGAATGFRDARRGGGHRRRGLRDLGPRGAELRRAGAPDRPQRRRRACSWAATSCPTRAG